MSKYLLKPSVFHMIHKRIVSLVACLQPSVVQSSDSSQKKPKPDCIIFYDCKPSLQTP